LTDTPQNIKDMAAHMAARIEAEAAASPPADDNGNGRADLSPQFIKDCLYANEMGDGILYAAAMADDFIYNKSAKEWYAWLGHHWQRDILDRAVSSVEKVAQIYLDESWRVTRDLKDADEENAAKLVKLRKDLIKRVNRLRTDRGRKAALKFSHTNLDNSLSLYGDEFDRQDFLLACKNGVIDLRTGELRDGRQSEYLCKASPIEYMGINAPAPVWEQTLNDIFQDDQELTRYMARVLGYGATGSVKEHILPVFYGQGRNGKGTIVETLRYILGDLAAPIQSEMLLDQGRSRSAAGPSSDIMSLWGLRFAFASESDEGRRFSPSRVKWLSGGDTLTGRRPHDKENITFLPTHLLILLTNNKPKAPADDFAFWERVHLVPFNISFVKREPRADNERLADMDLDQKLMAEAPGILAWLVRGCIDWQEQGINPPELITEATRKYRRHEDQLADFLDECCYLDADETVGASPIYTLFRKWWAKNVSSKWIPSQRQFGDWMSLKFKKDKHSISRTVIYYGVQIKPDTHWWFDDD